MPPPTETSAGSAGGILLVEEYDALAIAFGSALKSFARGYETRVVRSLAQAEAVLEEFKPALVVLDCDPPPRGAISFFTRLRSAVPAARALVLAAENSEEFTRENGAPAALQFMRKPFELQTFGETVHALLRAPRRGGVGTIRDLKLLDAILLHAMTAASAVLKVDGSGTRRGEIHFAAGRIVHAAVLGKAGIEALQTMLRWRAPRLAEEEIAPDAPRSIRGRWPVTLREALAGLKASPEKTVDETEVAPPASSAQAGEGKKFLIIDDTDLLLTFVEEILTTAHPGAEVLTASTGEEGFKSAAMARPDLILLDYSLPDRTGAQVCEQLLANEATAATPVIMMSGHVPEMVAAAERYENIVATIAKPFLSSALVELVQRTLAEPPRAARDRRAQVKENRSDSPASRNGEEAAVEEKPQVESPPAPPPDLPPASPTPPEETAPEEPSEPTAEAMVPSPLAAKSEHTTSVSTHVSLPSEEVAASIESARWNAVVVGLPLEVIDLRLSPALHVSEIRARLLASAVSLHILPKASLAAPTTPATIGKLGRVELGVQGRIGTLRVIPGSPGAETGPRRYGVAVDGVALHPSAQGDMLRLTPTATAPMRFELMALFELSRVELSPSFALEHLVLTLREEKMRATFFPEAAHLGTTVIARAVRLDPAGMLDEILLTAVQERAP